MSKTAAKPLKCGYWYQGKPIEDLPPKQLLEAAKLAFNGRRGAQRDVERLGSDLHLERKLHKVEINAKDFTLIAIIFLVLAFDLIKVLH